MLWWCYHDRPSGCHKLMNARLALLWLLVPVCGFADPAPTTITYVNVTQKVLVGDTLALNVQVSKNVATALLISTNGMRPAA